MFGKPVIVIVAQIGLMLYVKKYPTTFMNYKNISTSPNTVDRELRNLIVHPENALKLKETRDFAIKCIRVLTPKHFHKIHVKLL